MAVSKLNNMVEFSVKLAKNPCVCECDVILTSLLLFSRLCLFHFYSFALWPWQKSKMIFLNRVFH